MSTPTFEEERNVQNHATQWSYLRVRMTVPGQPHDLRIDLARHPKLHAEGHWDISMVGRAKGSGYHPEEVAAQNAFGPRQVRALATHLKTTYGIKSVSGHRVSGARQKANATEKDVRVDLGKGLRLAAHQPFPVQVGRYQQVADDWHHEGTLENPMNARKRVVETKDHEGNRQAVGTYALRQDPARLNHYHVEEVQAVTRGGGKAAMDHLTRMADRHGVSLQLVAEPLKPQGEGVKMTRAKLRAWYHEHGFRPRQGDLMVRTPTKLEKAMHTNPFHDLTDRLQKSWFMDRRVRFGSAKNPVNEGRTTTTMMADGKARKITTGPVKASRVPDPKKAPGALKKEVETVVASDFTTNRAGDAMLAPSAEFNNQRLRDRDVKVKDTDTVKHTFMRDGSVAAVRLFAKALMARMASLQKARRMAKPITDVHGDYHFSTQASWEPRTTGQTGQRTIHHDDVIEGSITHKDGSHGMDMFLSRDTENERPNVWQVYATPHKGTKPNQIGAGPMKAFADHIRSNYPEVTHVESWSNRPSRNNGVKKIGG